MLASGANEDEILSDYAYLEKAHFPPFMRTLLKPAGA